MRQYFAHWKELIISFALCSTIFGVYAGHRRAFPSDSALERQFIAHRGDFERLANMASEDTHIVCVTNGFTRLDTNASWPRKDVGISPARWDEYKRLFAPAGISNGISKDVDPTRLFFHIAARGLVTTGDEKGIVYSRAPLQPVLQSLDRRPPDALYQEGHVTAYKEIDKDWYIYYRAW